jgi:hypothetical protein
MRAPGRELFAGFTFNTVKVFSTADRAHLDRLVEAWLAEHPSLLLVDSVITESATGTETCVSITLFLHQRPLAVIERAPTTN